MHNYAWVNKTTNRIDNVIHWDGESPYTPPEEYDLVELPDIQGEWSTATIGWSYVNGQFVEPPRPAEPEAPVIAQPTNTGTQTV